MRLTSSGTGFVQNRSTFERQHRTGHRRSETGPIQEHTVIDTLNGGRLVYRDASGDKAIRPVQLDVDSLLGVGDYGHLKVLNNKRLKLGAGGFAETVESGLTEDYFYQPSLLHPMKLEGGIDADSVHTRTLYNYHADGLNVDAPKMTCEVTEKMVVSSRMSNYADVSETSDRPMKIEFHPSAAGDDPTSDGYTREAHIKACYGSENTPAEIILDCSSLSVGPHDTTVSVQNNKATLSSNTMTLIDEDTTPDQVGTNLSVTCHNTHVHALTNTTHEDVVVVDAKRTIFSAGQSVRSADIWFCPDAILYNGGASGFPPLCYGSEKQRLITSKALDGKADMVDPVFLTPGGVGGAPGAFGSVGKITTANALGSTFKNEIRFMQTNQIGAHGPSYISFAVLDSVSNNGTLSEVLRIQGNGDVEITGRLLVNGVVIA